jgi:hypothetical protein
MLFSHFRTKGLVWARLFGFGVVIKDTTRHNLTFSQLKGNAPGLKLGKWWIQYLPRGW